MIRIAQNSNKCKTADIHLFLDDSSNSVVYITWIASVEPIAMLYTLYDSINWSFAISTDAEAHF